MTPKLHPVEHYDLYLGINGNDTIDYHSLLPICKRVNNDTIKRRMSFWNRRLKHNLPYIIPPCLTTLAQYVGI